MDKVSAYIEKQIKGYQKRAEDAESQLATVTGQRDELLKACIAMRDDFELHVERHGCNSILGCTASRMALDAIAKCKEARDV